MVKRILLGLVVLIALASLLFVVLSEADLSVDELKSKYANEKSQYIDVQGMSVHYRIEGNWSAPALVLIHGTAASLHTWDAWVDYLAPHFKIVRFDLPAFGLTGPSPARDYSKEAYVEFLNNFTQEIGLTSFHLAGNSLGGDIAWNYAATYPEKVDKLVLVDAKRLFTQRKCTNYF